MRTGGESERPRAPFLSLSPPSLPPRLPVLAVSCSVHARSSFPRLAVSAPSDPTLLPFPWLARANLRRPFHIHTLPYSVPPPAPSTLSSTIKKHTSNSLIASGFAPSSAEHQDQESTICWPSSPQAALRCLVRDPASLCQSCSPIPRHLPATVPPFHIFYLGLLTIPPIRHGLHELSSQFQHSSSQAWPHSPSNLL